MTSSNLQLGATMDRLIMGVGLFFALGVPAAWVGYAESVLDASTSMLLELAPVDPRSLMQGDYMVLRYRLARDTDVDDTWPRTGTLAVTVSPDGVATAARRLDAGPPLGPDERRLTYRLRDGELRLGAESFFFQEGHAQVYDAARYGELRVDESGQAILVGLRDEDLAVLAPDE